jgi:hypothetical protein
MNMVNASENLKLVWNIATRPPEDFEKAVQDVEWLDLSDNFRMNTRSGRYGAAYNMVGLRCF